MKVNRDLEITKEEFFDTLLQDIADDITKNGNKPIKKKDLKKGFAYIYGADKSQNLQIKFEVIDYIENTFYSSRRTSVNGTTSVSYSVTETDKGINVVFEQISPQTNKKNIVSRLFTETLYLGRMTDHLYDIQKKVLVKQGKYLAQDVSLFGTPTRKKHIKNKSN